MASFIGFNPSGFVQLNPLAIADFNGDTRPDAAVGGVGNSRVSAFLNACGLAVPAQIQLNSSSSGWAVIESDGTAIMSIVRSGDITGPASVQYATRHGSAISSQDYTAISGTLNFAAGEI